MLVRLSRQLSSLTQLKSFSSISIDSSDLQSIQKHSVSDVTTNPSLLVKVLKSPESLELVKKTLQPFRDSRLTSVVMNKITDKILVDLGSQILSIIPGSIMVQLDPRLSFDTLGTVKSAENLINLYKEKRIPTSRVFFKIASTWEGIQACKILSAKGINCNLTLVFNKSQAIACAEAKAASISPYIGRITDWHKERTGAEFNLSEDPGVKTAKEIFYYIKKYHPKTTVLGASFRNVGQVLELAGCDKLTISPELLQELENSEIPVEKKLKTELENPKQEPKITQKKFRWLMNQDQVATEKLSEGIRNFSEDTETLHKLLRKQLKQKVEG